MTTAQIKDYEVMFTVRTGVTIMVSKVEAFNGHESDDIFFLPTEPKDNHSLTIMAGDHNLSLEGLNPDYWAEAVERGFIMFYELENDEVVRCTPCKIKA